MLISEEVLIFELQEWYNQFCMELNELCTALRALGEGSCVALHFMILAGCESMYARSTVPLCLMKVIKARES